MRKCIERKLDDVVVFNIIVFSFLVLIMSLSPMIIDDFMFQSLNLNGFIENINYSLGYGNGRLLGNLGILYLMKYPLLKIIIKSLAIVFLINLIRKVLFITEDNNIQLSVLSFLLIIGIAPQIFAEVFTWTSGFANYVPPIICMLLCLIIIQNENTHLKHETILIFVLGVAGQLFVEHSTVINMATALVALFYSQKCNREKIFVNMVWLSGTTIGTITMVFIPKLFCEFNEFEGYQKLNLHGIRELIISIVSNAMYISKLISENVILFLALSMLLICIIRKKKCLKKADRTALTILAVYPIFCILSYAFRISQNEIKYNLIYFGCLVVYVISVAYCILTAITVRNLQIKAMFFGLMAIFSILPLLIVYPIGNRCLLHSYIFLSLLVLLLFESVYYSSSPQKVISCGLTVVAVILMFAICACFKNINSVDKMKHQYIKEQMHVYAQKIEIPDIDSDYVPVKENCMIEYKYFYEEKGDIEFANVDYKTWRQDK